MFSYTFFQLGAKCDQTALRSAVDQLDSFLFQMEIWLASIEKSKTNLRKVIDCHHNRGLRNDLFVRYEELCERKIILTNVKTDLQIKKTILEKEQQRCTDRCK